MISIHPIRLPAIFCVLLGCAVTSQANPVGAKSADAFVDSMGVCTHWTYPDTPYGANYGTVKQRLMESGLRHVRDGGANATAISRMKDLATNGIRTVYVMDPGAGIVPTTNYWSPSRTTRYLLVDFIKNQVGPAAFSGLEIMNEIDLFYKRDSFISDPTQAGYFWVAGDTSVTNKLTNDVSSPVWWGRYITNITQDAYAAMKADPATAQIPVIGPSLGKTYDYGANPLPVGCLSSFVDWGCFHPYPGGNPFSDHFSYATVDWYIGHGGQPSANMDEYRYAFSVYQPTFGTKPMAATETGYFTGTADYSVTEEVQAKYVPRLYLEYFSKGIPRTCLYEFVDEFNNLANDQACRGLLRNDLSPKPAYTAVKNLIALLNDPGPAFNPGALDYTVTKNPPAGYTRTQYLRHQLFQKRDGSFWLVLYHEIANSSAYTSNGVFTTGTTRAITHPEIPVTITFNTPIKEARIYLSNISSNAIATNFGPAQLQLNVPDHPLIVKLTTNRAANVRLTVPVSGSIFSAGEGIPLRAEASINGGAISKIEFYDENTPIGETTNFAVGATWNSAPTGYHLLRARAIDEYGTGTFSDLVPVVVSASVGNPTPVMLIPTGAVWKYLDDGSNQGTAWRGTNFDDSGWKSGPAQFGYGDNDEATVVSYGPSSNNKYITTYFRKTFVLGDYWHLTNMNLRLLRDDGAVVYWNGNEIFRNNMPAGTISYTTLASTNVGGTDETTHFYSCPLNPVWRPALTNVLAVEVHQYSTNSTDLSFDLELRADFADPRTTLSTRRAGSDLVVAWPDALQGISLLGATNLAWPISWLPVTNAILNANGTNRVQFTPSEGQMFFRLGK